MASCNQSMGRKRTLADPCSSSQTHTKCPRIASTTIDPCLALSDPQCSHKSSSASSSCDPSAPSSVSTLRNSSDPFPRYSLGIPHLDTLLPLRDGLDLLHAYHQGISWIYTPVDRTTLLETLEEAERHGADSIHPHRLACLLAALALGDLFSPCFPPHASSSSRPDSGAASPTKRGRIWFGVASACLAGSRKNIELMHNPTPDACSALYLMSTYLLCSNDEELFHRSQGLTGLALILAKSALSPSSASFPQARSASQVGAPSIASQHQAAADSLSTPSPHALPAAASVATDQDRLHCTRLLSDLVFHLRCQALTFALPCPFATNSARQSAVPLANLPDVPTIQAIWTSFGTPLYASLDAFGSRYSPNIFHNWKLGLADLMHQVSSLTNQAITLDNLNSPFPASCSAETATSLQRKQSKKITLPDHNHVVKLDERIRRYHASLPDFLLLHKPLPIQMAGKVDEDELAQIICQRHMACSMVHRMLMALHRPWFLSALACRSRTAKADTAQLYRSSAASEVNATSTEPESERSGSRSKATDSASVEQPSPSAMFSLSAVLRSATWQTETYASAAACAPPQALAWWQFTNNALAAAVVQATALLRLSCHSKSNTSTPAKQTPAAQKSDASSHFHTQMRSDLDKNICSFQNVAKRCKLAAKALPFLQRVSSAIDLGICKSRVSSGQDALQSSILTEQHCEPASSAASSPSTSPLSTDTLTRTCSDRVLSFFTCNNISNSNSNTNVSNSNSNSIIGTIDSHSNPAVIKIGKDGQVRIERQSDTLKAGPSSGAPLLFDSNTSAALNGSQHGRPKDARRASSTKSELETIFGPMASGLEPPEASASQAPVKPLYRQSWEPIPVPPSSDDQSSQAPSSDGAGSSSASSAACPRTPRSGSPQLNADGGTHVGPEEVKETPSGEPKKRNSASDLVLECIRFWQPEMLATPVSG